MPRYIDAELAEAAMKKAYDQDVELYGGVEILECFPAEDAISILNTIPKADVAPIVHAHWEYHESVCTGEGRTGVYVCSACKAAVPEAVFDFLMDGFYKDFCGACGARMDEEVKKNETDV